MQHLLAYTASVAAGAVNADMPGVADGYASFSNNHYLLPQTLWALGNYAQGTGISNARLNSPTLRNISLPSIVPVNVATAPGTLAPINLYPQGMFRLPATDELAMEATSVDAGAQRFIGGLWVGDKNLNIPQGEVYTIIATSSITAGNLVWGFGAFTLTQGLPSGRYEVVGMDVIGANLIFARLVFPNGGMKPGVLARASTAVTPQHAFRYGRLGSFGQFDSWAMPGIELFGSAAPTTQVIFLDIVKIR